MGERIHSSLLQIDGCTGKPYTVEANTIIHGTIDGLLSTTMVHLITGRGEVHRFAVSVSHTCCCLRKVVPCLVREGLVRSKQAHFFGSRSASWLLNGC